MNNCYRIEVNGKSKYFDSEEKAIKYYVKQLDLNKDVEFWIVTYCFNEKFKIYIATQSLVDYSIRKECV